MYFVNPFTTSTPPDGRAHPALGRQASQAYTRAMCREATTRSNSRSNHKLRPDAKRADVSPQCRHRLGQQAHRATGLPKHPKNVIGQWDAVGPDFQSAKRQRCRAGGDRRGPDGRQCVDVTGFSITDFRIQPGVQRRRGGSEKSLHSSALRLHKNRTRADQAVLSAAEGHHRHRRGAAVDEDPGRRAVTEPAGVLGEAVQKWDGKLPGQHVRTVRDPVHRRG